MESTDDIDNRVAEVDGSLSIDAADMRFAASVTQLCGKIIRDLDGVARCTTCNKIRTARLEKTKANAQI